jgi:hypothetical protein
VTAAVLSPAPVTAEAHAVLHMALDAVAAWPAGGKAREAVFSAVVTLGCALCGCRQHGGEAAVPAATDELIRVMSEHCGPGWGEAL